MPRDTNYHTKPLLHNLNQQPLKQSPRNITLKLALYNQIHTCKKEQEYELLANKCTLADVAALILEQCNVDPSCFGLGCEPYLFFIVAKGYT